jgi:hypothetical protein
MQINSFLWALPIPYIHSIRVPNKLAIGEKVVYRKYENKEKSRNFINYYKQVEISFWESVKPLRIATFLLVLLVFNYFG